LPPNVCRIVFLERVKLIYVCVSVFVPDDSGAVIHRPKEDVTASFDMNLISRAFGQFEW
jgi:hypothetical protein